MLRNLFTSRWTPPDTLLSTSSARSKSRSNSSMSTSPHGSCIYDHQSPSPVPLPPLMPDDDLADQASGDVSIGVLTPAFGPLESPPKILGEDVFEAGLSGSDPPTPPIRQFRFASHSPLRKSLGFSQEDYFSSNPGSSSTKAWTLSGIPPHLSRTKSHLMANPYYASPQTFHTTASYLPRVPRRMRPCILVGLCLFVITIVFFFRAISQSSRMDVLMAQRRAALLEQKYVEHGLMDINTAKQADADHEAILEVQRAPVEAQPLVKFTNTKDELIALISFITATTANALSPFDPESPLEPAAILDFDPSKDDGTQDFEFLKTETNTVYPIVLFGRMRDPWHLEIQKILTEMKIVPPPLIVDIDQRQDHLLITPLLTRLFGGGAHEELRALAGESLGMGGDGHMEFPQLTLAGESLGSYHDIIALQDAGKLRSTLEASGLVSFRDVKKVNKGAKERERLDNERVLAPKRIIDGV